MSNFATVRNRKRRNYNAKGKGLNRKQKQQIQKMIVAPAEKKYYDTSYDAISVSLTPSYIDLTAPARGTDNNERVGSQIDLKSIQYRFAFVKSDTTNYIRYVIFQWRPDSEHDLPSWSQMFQYHTGAAPIGLTDIMSPYQLGEGGTANFKVLVDEQFYSDSDNPIQIVKGFINKGFNPKVACDGTVHQGNNHIFLMYVSDSGTASHPLIYGYTRVRYTDS